jgi:UDP-N-acetylmuramoyl-L-alanyl-D-glutamate--2,6-diaminopimelate ligase
MARLNDLLGALTVPVLRGWHGPEVLIDSVTSDSRVIGPRVAFVATHHRGYARDGHEFIEDAVNRGAPAVFVERLPPVIPPVPVVVVSSTSVALAQLAAALAGWPARHLDVVGITGTDGKTTTSVMTHAILVADGRSPGLVATVATGVGASLSLNRAHVTTPDPVAIQKLLAATVATGGTAAVLEATSHGLDQGRVDAIEFDVAVVTRITHDHLDYHGTYEVYREAKAGLIDRLARGLWPSKKQDAPIPKVVALLASDPAFDFLAERARRVGASVTAFGVDDETATRWPTKADRTVRATNLKQSAWGTVATVETPWGRGHLEVRLPGVFNVLNSLAAIAATGPLDVPLEVSLPALSRVDAVESLPGRMTRLDQGQPFTVVVDFAHTPDSLANVLREMRARTSGQLIVVFGAAGERDRAKRPEMGRVAASYADVAVLTEEDPRFEDREAIIADIAAGAVEAGSVEGAGFIRVPGRREAIRTAVGLARSGDIVVLAGKGHETTIDGAIEGRAHSVAWNEFEEARDALRRAGYGSDRSRNH